MPVADITLSLTPDAAKEALVDFASYGSRYLVTTLMEAAKDSGIPFSAADLNMAAAAAEKGGHRVLAGVLDNQRMDASRPEIQSVNITLSLSPDAAKEALVDFASYGSRYLVSNLIRAAKDSGSPFSAQDLNIAAAAAEKGGRRVLAGLLDNERINASRPGIEAVAGSQLVLSA